MSQDLEQKLFQQQEILLYIAGRINKRSSDRIIIEVSALLENYDRPSSHPTDQQRVYRKVTLSKRPTYAALTTNVMDE